MRRITRLIKEGQEAAIFRGHVMTRAKHFNGDYAIAYCTRCKKGFVATPDPMPNNAELIGAALSVGCND